MSADHMIDITGVDLHGFVRKAYELSPPSGHEQITHWVQKPLSDEAIELLLRRNDEFYAAKIYYVQGCAVKLTVFNRDGRLYVDKEWMGHTTAQLAQLLEVAAKSADTLTD